MKVFPSAPLRFSMSPLDMAQLSAVNRFSSLRGLGGSGQPAGTLASWGPFQAAVSAAQASGYSTPYNAVYAQTGSAMMCVNADNTYSYIYDWFHYPPTNIWPGAAAGVTQSFILPPQSVWQAAVVSLGLASLADLQAANTAAAVAAAQTACNTTGGTWNAGSNSCIVAAGTPAPTYTPQTGFSPSVTFTASRANSAISPTSMQVGDSFRIQVTSAAPNALVQAYRSDGASGDLGYTDAAGNYSYSGAITAGYPYGTFVETIKVNGVNAGQYTFAINQSAPTQTPTYTPPSYTPPAGSGGSMSSGTLSFTSSRGGSQFQPGDTWRITISGAAPNSPVSVFGIHPDGSQATSVLGNTDGQGNYTLTGTFGPADHGTWQETWYVGSQQVGQAFSFTVSSTSSGSSTTGTGTGPTGSGSGVPGGSGSQSTSGQVIAGIPNNYLALGGGALLLVMLMGRR